MVPSLYASMKVGLAPIADWYFSLRGEGQEPGQRNVRLGRDMVGPNHDLTRRSLPSPPPDRWLAKIDNWFSNGPDIAALSAALATSAA